ncbi:hypothetical protein COW81_02290 [Candidatus Campbellbacteria bacterium CG22_combo_CG10-13_8_21_14_all_36_13]|uniref:Protease PrsW n=1 Tax=Candidatus Campbellbacteria bacterium CG22_combo_CG10-13_8_21_14_all_36_13 TaxID=1974529 RepID=A0A2H0DZR7_9BACT|nr:MAG: hypothetical protein COW81_02290 [Candidatus Campbellbacteria bacterium CG22_combo_CG10-13_8_21_14_all_36_13]
MEIPTIAWALIGGLLPALLWLWFWLHEDRKRPEPKSKLFLAFVLGMISTLLVIPIEGFLDGYIIGNTVLLVILWATTEELFKYIAAFFSGLHTKANNEPIDAIIYMITAALGFAAMENALFLLTPLGAGHIADTIITGNMRFIGATVLHILSSGTVGVFMAMSFYRKKIVKKEFVFVGLILSIVLHTIFNLLIMNNTGGNIFGIFLLVWISVGILLMFFEKAKHLRP